MGGSRSVLCAALVFAAGCGEIADDADARPGDVIDAASVVVDAAAGTPDSSDVGEPDAADVPGCTSSASCTAAQFCDFAENDCGEGPNNGTCRPLPDACSGGAVCSCNGTVYSDECAAAGAGFDVNAKSACPTPGGFFECGYRYCLEGFAYCEERPSSTPGQPDGFACPSLPVDCDACDCLRDVAPCGEFCVVDANGNLTVTCPPE